MQPTTADRTPLAQRGLTLWARVAVGAFYGRIRVSPSTTPLNGRPVVVAVNHSNALGDVALLLKVLPQFPRFLAASSWWRHAPARLLFRLGRVLPVGRRGDGATPGLNGETFAACHEALAAADHIAIFPEGVLNSGDTLLPLRTGAARIALSAALDSDVRGVVIAPVALAYESRGRVGSDVVVRFAEPIDVDAWVEAHRPEDARAEGDGAEGDGDPVAMAHALTALLQDRLGSAFTRANHEVRERLTPVAADRRRRARRMAVLAPVATAGVAANAPAILPIALGSHFVRHEGWQATTKGVAATALLPLSWIGTGVVLSRRWGPTRAGMAVAAAAGSGWTALSCLGSMRDLYTRRTALPPG